MKLRNLARIEQAIFGGARAGRRCQGERRFRLALEVAGQEPVRGERLGRRYANDPFVVLAVSGDPNSGRVGPFLAEHRVTLPVGLDPAGDLAKSFGVRTLSTTVIIDRNGYIAAIAFGPRAWYGKASIALIEAMIR